MRKDEVMEVKRILFPTDFSEKTEKAIPFLINMAEKTNSEIVFFHAYKVPEMVVDLPYDTIKDEVKAFEETALKSLDQLTEKIKAINSKISVKNVAKPGHFTSELNPVIEEYKVDLVIMATKGIEGIVTTIFGTHAEKVIEVVNVPVIVLPQQTNFSTIKNVVFASEYHESDIETIQFLSGIAGLFDADLTIINVYAENLILERLRTNEFQDMVKEEVSYPKLHFKYLKGDDVYSTIETYVEENNVELVAMTTHHRKLFEKLFHDSVTQKMVKHGKTPILAFH